MTIFPGLSIEGWAQRSACVGMASPDVPAEICNLCPVALDCLEHALTHDMPAGTWGGFNRQGRDELMAAARGDIREALLAAHRVYGERRARNLELARRVHPSRTRSAPT